MLNSSMKRLNFDLEDFPTWPWSSDKKEGKECVVGLFPNRKYPY